MGNENKLEEIFLKNGKFVNSKGKKVDPEIVSLPRMIHKYRDLNINQAIIKSLKERDEEANAFLLGDRNELWFDQYDSNSIRTYYPVQFYKI